MIQYEYKVDTGFKRDIIGTETEYWYLNEDMELCGPPIFDIDGKLAYYWKRKIEVIKEEK